MQIHLNTVLLTLLDITSANLSLPLGQHQWRRHIRRENRMIIEALIAFVLIFVSTLVIYRLGKRAAPKTTISENEQAAYACGEKVSFQGLKINVSLYKYLIYFIIFDSSVLVLAFASFALGVTNPLLLILYLGIILAAGVVLLDGGKD
jgi:NADH:ubiquinone oxidoreductase subunit 3 (subunit A)